MGSNRRRRRVEPTDEWEQIELLCGWPEQRDYELIRPSVLFGSPASERAKETAAASERTLQRRVVRFEAEGMESLFDVRFGRRPARKTVKRVLAEEPTPLRFVRRFPPYHEIPEPAERRRAVVALHAEGWSAKAIAGYLRMHRSTVHRVLRRRVEEGVEGLEDRPHGGGRPASARWT